MKCNFSGARLELGPYDPVMPSYEFRCRTCGATFTEGRAMTDSAEPATCPQGHDDTVRLFGIAGVARSDRPASEPSGGCCGGACGCG